MHLNLENFIGQAGASQIQLNDEKIIRLPDNPCKFAMLAHWNTTAEPDPDIIIGGESASGGYEIYWGFNGVLAFQLFGTNSTILLPVNNTNQIVAKAGSGTPYLYFAWFW